VEKLGEELGAGKDAGQALAAAAATAREAAEATKGMLAKRGRASYSGDRSRDSVDAGAMGVAVIFEDVARAWSASTVETPEGGTA
jgi:dihydroxyacetone kinase